MKKVYIKSILFPNARKETAERRRNALGAGMVFVSSLGLFFILSPLFPTPDNPLIVDTKNGATSNAIRIGGGVSFVKHTRATEEGSPEDVIVERVDGLTGFHAEANSDGNPGCRVIGIPLDPSRGSFSDQVREASGILCSGDSDHVAAASGDIIPTQSGASVKPTAPDTLHN